MAESRTFEAATDWDALRIGRMLCGYAENAELTSAMITDERGRVVWPTLREVGRP